MVIHQFPKVPVAAEMAAELTGIPIPAAGAYWLVVYSEGRELSCLRLFEP